MSLAVGIDRQIGEKQTSAFAGFHHIVDLVNQIAAELSGSLSSPDRLSTSQAMLNDCSNISL